MACQDELLDFPKPENSQTTNKFCSLCGSLLLLGQGGFCITPHPFPHGSRFNNRRAEVLNIEKNHQRVNCYNSIVLDYVILKNELLP